MLKSNEIMQGIKDRLFVLREFWTPNGSNSRAQKIHKILNKKVTFILCPQFDSLGHCYEGVLCYKEGGNHCILSSGHLTCVFFEFKLAEHKLR